MFIEHKIYFSMLRKCKLLFNTKSINKHFKCVTQSFTRKTEVIKMTERHAIVRLKLSRLFLNNSELLAKTNNLFYAHIL